MRFEIEWEMQGRIFINGKMAKLLIKVNPPDSFIHLWTLDRRGATDRFQAALKNLDADTIEAAVMKAMSEVPNDK